MIHPRVHLITAEVVATMRGISCEAVYHHVDTGDGWMWVWNVGAGKERSLRFWSQEQNQPAAMELEHARQLHREQLNLNLNGGDK